MIETLAPLVLPDPHRRDHVVPERLRIPGYDAGYDFHTFFYDAVHMPDRGALWLFAPKFAGFERLLPGMTLDGAPARVRRIRRFERYDIAEITAPAAPRRLRVTVGDWSAEVTPSIADATTFAGRNVLLTLSRNNDLTWIADWVRFHVAEHGADAVLFYDNGSQGYGPEEIAAALAPLPGLRAVRVLSAPFPYGPQARGRQKFRANFLQAALLNLSRWRFLAPARAVLQCDVDELVDRRDGPSIFDATVASGHQFIRVPGVWRFPNSGDRMPRHRDHILRGAEERTCPPKYCIVPEGPMRGKSWATHGLHGTWFGKRFIHRDYRFLHCYGISDFWKNRPKSAAATAAEIDPEAEALFARALPDMPPAP